MVNCTALKAHFPLIRERSEIMQEIQTNDKLSRIYEEWSLRQQEEFLNFCTGVRGMKILYDSFFKEALNSEYDVSRLEFFLCTVLKKKVKILRILPNDSTRIADETSLLITDIVVELEDGSLANVEIQKIGYAFPGPRCACYGADMLLRQYKRVRGEKGTSFSYHDIRNVYLIVLYEQSPGEFRNFPDIYYHYGKQKFESGLELDMLQEYVMIPLDIFKKCMHNKTITTDLEAWLTFLSEDRPEKIIELITAYPAFKAMYETLYSMCLNTERVMEMFSEELRILDRNTVQYMMDEQQKQVEEQRKLIEEQNQQIEEQNQQIEEQNQQIEEQSQQIEGQSQRIEEQSQQIDAQNQQIDVQSQQIDEQNQELAAQRRQLEQQAAEIEELKKKLAEVKN